MIEVYLDDTGAEHFVGFGGFAGNADEWKKLEFIFRALNEKHNISEFHARSCSYLVVEYALRVLDYRLYLVGFTIDVPGYLEYARERVRDPFLHNKFASTAGACARRIFDWLHWHPNEQCALFVDCKKNYSQSVVDAITHEAERSERNPLISVTILNEENRYLFPGRQVADLGANLTAKHVAACHYGLRTGKDLAHAFYDRNRWLGIIHCPEDNVEKLADIFTDPEWSKML
jgi:hypothetical protein